jgi:hypothetical protein
MRIELIGLDPKTHRFRVVRSDGSTESVDLETRSYLVHDLTHYAVERTLQLARGFYGLLASGTAMAELNDRTRPWPTGTEIAFAESIVGPMQSHLSGKQVTLPADWHFVAAVEAEYRRAYGQWRGTPFGQPCVLVWP